jgi:hypothetical protein
VALVAGIPHSRNPIRPSDRPCANPDQPLSEVSVVSLLVETGIMRLPLRTAPARRDSRNRKWTIAPNHVLAVHTRVRLRATHHRDFDDICLPSHAFVYPPSPLHPIQCHLNPPLHMHSLVVASFSVSHRRHEVRLSTPSLSTPRRLPPSKPYAKLPRRCPHPRVAFACVVRACRASPFASVAYAVSRDPRVLLNFFRL